jgi:hypothetical protein
MNYIEAPNEYCGIGPSVFIAGGISDTENWQAEFIRQIEGHGVSAIAHDFRTAAGRGSTPLGPGRIRFRTDRDSCSQAPGEAAPDCRTSRCT